MFLTAKDMQDTMMRYMGGQSNAEAIIDCRQSILNALGELWGKHEWPWYQNQHVMQLNAPYSTGTVTFDATTLRFTLSGGTWPSWANYGCIKIGTKDARVTKIISSTVIQIETGTPFLTNITTPSTYTLYCNEYPVPNGIRKMGYVFLEENAYAPLQYMPAIEFRAKQPGTFGAVPLYYTIQRDRNPLGQLVVAFWPYPTRAYTARFSYIRQANEVSLWEASDGKITSIAGTTTITGTGTAFDSYCTDSLLRIGKDNVNVPTARTGQYGFKEETRVDSVTSTTSLEVSPAPAFSSGGPVKYCISNLIDIDQRLMHSAFMLQCYFELSKIRNLSDRDQEEIKKNLDRAIRDAKARSNPTEEITYAGTFSNLRRYAGVWFNIGV